MSPEFTYAWYEAFLDHARRVGVLSRLDEAGCDASPRILLRHDVDFALEPAEALARVEERAGVRSTFLVQVTSHYYNVAAPAARALLQDLVLRGFEVGLHFDPTVAGDSEAAWAERCAAERAFLERLAGAPLRSVSLHMPGAHGRYPLFEDVVNAYDPRWFGPDRYLSDSLRVWRHDPYAFVEQAAARGLTSQVLTHPIHYGEKAASYVELMGGVCVRWCTEACEYAARHNATYRRERESGGR